MKNIIDILFYGCGIFLPMIIVFCSFSKRTKHKFTYVIEKIIISVIIFFIFYIIRLGFNSYYLDGEKTMNNLDDKSTTTNVTQTTTKSSDNNSSKINIEEIDGVTYINGVLIANKTYALPESFVPKNTYKDATGKRSCAECINKDAYEKYQEMDADATSLGLNIWIQSGYRSYELQESLYNNYVNKDGKEAADTYSARPGHSEHQTGLAFDLNTITDDFQYTDEGKWINENAYRYGFILRYPKGKEEYTGYKYESWHLRYVGEDLAKILYNDGDWITLEEYFNITSKYD